MMYFFLTLHMFAGVETLISDYLPELLFTEEFDDVFGVLDTPDNISFNISILSFPVICFVIKSISSCSVNRTVNFFPILINTCIR